MKLIVEMEMPKNCYLCPMSNFFVDKQPYCRLTMRWEECTQNGFKRPSWCPIKGVLPDQHGDLVDKETAKNAFDSSFLTFRMKDGETMRGFYKRTIDELPVLIAAERKDDGKTAD